MVVWIMAFPSTTVRRVDVQLFAAAISKVELPIVTHGGEHCGDELASDSLAVSNRETV